MTTQTYLLTYFSVFWKNKSTAKFSFLFFQILFYNLAFGQSDNKLRRITPKWKLGDERIVNTKSETKIFIKDSLINKTEATSNYNIKVIDTVKYYTLFYSSKPNQIDIVTKSSSSKVDSIVSLLTDIIKMIEIETQSFTYELLIDKNSGQAIKVKNSNKFLKFIEQVTSNVVDEFMEKMKNSNNQMDSIKQKVITQFKLSEPKILETILNQFNYIMQPYAYEFPYNSSISQNAMIHDVNALGTLGDVEMPAVLIISSKKIDNILIVKTDTDYDKEFLLEIVKKKYKNVSDLTTSNIFLSEKTESSFSIRNGWIVSHKSSVVFKTKEVKVVSESVVSFQ